MDWGDPFQSGWQNITSGAKDLSNWAQQSNPHLMAAGDYLKHWGQQLGGALGIGGGGGGGGGDGQNWFGYMPEYLQQADVSLKNLMTGGAASDPYIKSLQDVYKQNIRGAQADRGGFYGGKAMEEEASGMTQIYQQAANQEMQNYLNYIGLARPQALTPQALQPGFGSYLGQGLGAGAGAGLAKLLFG